MSFPSVDALQKTLTGEVFHYAKDPKKAAGRALGTLVEIITFYTLRSWGLLRGMAIERPIAEHGNPEITHNVEYSLHPIVEYRRIELAGTVLPLTAAKLRREVAGIGDAGGNHLPNGALVSADHVIRNCCKLSESANSAWIAHLIDLSGSNAIIEVSRLHPHPHAIVECKRVGVEEGMRKGPQTIEKAKQGAYVARIASSLQKIRLADGRLGGFIAMPDESVLCKPYHELLREVIDSSNPDFLRGFTMTVGVVSNHGNWFTAENQNKELKVLAQSYDWLLFLSDQGLSDFITELLLAPKRELKPARDAFLSSYAGTKTRNRFTKVQMDYKADRVLDEFFTSHKSRVEGWFNIIAPRSGSLNELRSELGTLQEKNWKHILTP